MRQAIGLLVFAVLLSGCAQGPRVNPAQVADAKDAQCRQAWIDVENGFPEYARCVRGAIASEPILNSGPNTDLVTRYLAGVNVLTEQVADGRVTDAQAFLYSAEWYGVVKDEYITRLRYAADIDHRNAVLQQRRNEALLNYSAEMWQQGAPRTLGGPAVTCYRVGIQTQCY